jgi:undecaprenyl diphosphate synthase
MRLSGEAITDAALSEALLDPVGSEPDLALILGPPDVLPTSLVWELAYSELVFLDIAWSDLQSGHLEMAIDDFNRRHRRFGGLDS